MVFKYARRQCVRNFVFFKRPPNRHDQNVLVSWVIRISVLILNLIFGFSFKKSKQSCNNDSWWPIIDKSWTWKCLSICDCLHTSWRWMHPQLWIEDVLMDFDGIFQPFSSKHSMILCCEREFGIPLCSWRISFFPGFLTRVYPSTWTFDYQWFCVSDFFYLFWVSLPNHCPLFEK